MTARVGRDVAALARAQIDKIRTLRCAQELLGYSDVAEHRGWFEGELPAWLARRAEIERAG